MEILHEFCPIALDAGQSGGYNCGMRPQPDRRQRSDPSPRAKPAGQARRERLEPLLRRRAARTQLRPGDREPKRWSSS
jgi:hypothetical protein